jgi:hypothetical protein
MKILVSLTHNLEFEDKFVTGYLKNRCYVGSSYNNYLGGIAWAGKIQHVPIFEYEYNPAYFQKSKGRVNTRIRYEGTRGQEQLPAPKFDVYCKLTLWQRQKLNWMMGKHSIQQGSVIRWVIEGVVGCLLAWYGIVQNNKADRFETEKEKLIQQQAEFKQKINGMDSIIQSNYTNILTRDVTIKEQRELLHFMDSLQRFPKK